MTMNLKAHHSRTNSHTISHNIGSKLLRLLPILIFAILSASPAGAKSTSTMKNSFEHPDFDFPKTVASNARKELKKALKAEQPVTAIRAAMQITIADSEVSESFTEANLQLFDSLANTLPEPYGAMCLLVEARIYASIYEENSWRFDRRTVPTDTYPDNLQEWGTQLFAKKIHELSDAVYAAHVSLGTCPITELAPLLEEMSEADIEAYPTALDLAADVMVDALDLFTEAETDPIIPFTDGETVKAETRVEKWCALLTEFHKGQPLPYAMALLRQLANTPAGTISLPRQIAALEGTPGQAPLILEYASRQRYQDFEVRADLVRLIDNNLRAFPDGYLANTLRNRRAELLSPSGVITAQAQVLSGEQIPVKIEMTNLTEATLLVLPLEPFGKVDIKVWLFKPKPVRTIPVSVKGEAPFRCDTTVTLDPLPFGRYALVLADKEGKWQDARNSNPVVLRVSDIAMQRVANPNCPSDNGIYVCDARTFAPIAGAKAEFVKPNGEKLERTAETDRNGRIQLNLKEDSYLRITVGDDHAEYNIWSNLDGRKSADERRLKAHIFTDLAIYKPGQEVKGVVLFYTEQRGVKEIAPREYGDLVLENPDRMEVGSMLVKSDSTGRGEFSFTIPKDGKLGTYRLRQHDKNKGYLDYCSVEVADYVAPKFFVELEQPTGGAELGDVITIQGKATTYSGMPVAGASVEFIVEYHSWWLWRFGSTGAKYTGQASTGTDGTFTISLPTKGLKGTPYEKGSFMITASVTSENGETQKDFTFFRIGNAYTLSLETTGMQEVTGGTLPLKATVKDVLGNEVEQRLEYTLTPLFETDLKPLQGEFSGNGATISVASLPSGKYELKVKSPEGDCDAESSVILWRQGDNEAPCGLLLWAPDDKVYATPGQKAVEVTVGSAYPGSHILCLTGESTGPMTAQWLEVDRLNRKVSVPVPADGEETRLILGTMHNLERAEDQVTIYPASAKSELKVEAISFRDKLVPQAPERWTFQFTNPKNAGGNAGEVGAMAVMTDKALNALAPFSWGWTPWGTYYRFPHLDFLNFMHPESSSFNFSTWKYLACNPDYTSPEFETYDIGFSCYFERPMLCYDMCDGAATGGSVTRNSLPRTMAIKSSAKVEMMEEATVEKELEARGPDTQGELRPVEFPLAFFMPRLQADEEGRLEIQFDVPDTNTTWQFQLFGYTPDMLATTLIRDAVAAKPVMVQSNVPRFLRSGDTTVLKATLMNASDATLPVGGRIEVFNPGNGELLDSREFPAEPLDSKGSRTVALDFQAGNYEGILGVRAFAFAETPEGTFRDGEQAIFALLPSSSPVVEAVNFYLRPNAEAFHTPLPDYPADAKVTLHYCDNPVWLCASSLPELQEATDKADVLSAVRALFANTVALRIVAKYPALAPLFDQEKAKTECTRLTRLIRERQHSSGGWSWCPGMKASQYITGRVLLNFAAMKELDALPDDCGDIIPKALHFCEKEICDYYQAHKKNYNYLGLLNYVYIRSYFPGIAYDDSMFPRLRDRALDLIASNWHDFDIYDRATAAIVLSRSGKKREVGNILESLRQLSMSSPEYGVWYDNIRSGWNSFPRLIITTQVLEAFREIEPGDTDMIDGLRQWLVVQRQGQDWKKESYTVEVVSALLNSGTDWTESSPELEITLNGEPLALPESPDLSGQYTLPLDPKAASGALLAVSGKGIHPSWGGVLSEYIQPMKDVKEAKTPQISVSKKLMRLEGNKVRVLLTLVTDRDLDYVTLTDERAACMEPEEQISGYMVQDGIWYYRQVRNSQTDLYFDFLPKGTHILWYDCYLDRDGEYALGIATAQSLIAPTLVSHSGGTVVKVP